MKDAIDRSFSARLDCHYLLHAPDTVNARTPLAVALHGFGSNPETMLHLTARLFERPPVLAALQGPYQFFLPAKNQEVGYGWITNRRPAESIRLHREMALHVLDEAGRQFGIPPDRRLLVGFSQAVSLNYRFAATCPDAVRGVIAIGGGLPGDWDEGDYQPVTSTSPGARTNTTHRMSPGSMRSASAVVPPTSSFIRSTAATRCPRAVKDS
jgi:phospholipase/carboxylesterase